VQPNHESVVSVSTLPSEELMNSIIYLVGLVVVVIAVLSLIGLR
jgi:hypothetical protein